MGKRKMLSKLLKLSCENVNLTKQDPFLALLDWRNTLSENIGSSAVQKLMGRRTRTKLPIKSSLLRPTIPKDVKNGLEK
jgi:hypothetical protein